MKKIIIISFFIILSNICSAQSTDDNDPIDVNRFRIGIKLGLPDGIGLGLEYVTPLLDNRIAPYVDYGIIKVSDVDVNYFEIGSNIYFNSKARGGYVSLGYGNLNSEVSNLDGETDDGIEYTNGMAKEQITSFNLKLGGKWGRKLYFRLEGGYAFGQLPHEILITGDVDGQQESILLSIDEVFEYVSDKGYPIFNLGFGYSF